MIQKDTHEDENNLLLGESLLLGIIVWQYFVKLTPAIDSSNYLNMINSSIIIWGTC